MGFLTLATFTRLVQLALTAHTREGGKPDIRICHLEVFRTVAHFTGATPMRLVSPAHTMNTSGSPAFLVFVLLGQILNLL